MEYFIENTNLALLKIDNEYRLLYEATKKTNDEEEKNEISSKSDNLIKRAWDKVKLLIQRIKNFFFEKKVNKMLDNMNKMNDKCEVKVPEGETPKSFQAKIDLFIKKLKNKKLTKEEVVDMKSKMAKGIVVTTTAVVAATLGKRLVSAIPVCDELANEYDDEKVVEHKLDQKNKRDERIDHLNKYKQKYKDKHESDGTGPFKYAATHMISGIISIVQDGVGHIINNIKNDDKDLPTKYRDLSMEQRIKANEQIKDKAKIKAAEARDKMDTYEETMENLKSQGKEDSTEYETYKKKYDEAYNEYKKYTHINRK